MAQQWVWLDAQVLLTIHEEQLAEHGGGVGIRDMGLFESAISKPQQLEHYGKPDVFDLAAAYGFGIARNHPFIDGNKRTAFVAMELFLALNGFELNATDEGCIETMLAVAEGSITEVRFAQWIRAHTASD